MAQQTAVEWLIEQLEQQVYTIDHKDNRVIPKSFDDIIQIKKQAKEMESSQTDSEYKKGWEAAEKSLSKEIEKIHEYYRSHRPI